MSNYSLFTNQTIKRQQVTNWWIFIFILHPRTYIMGQVCRFGILTTRSFGKVRCDPPKRRESWESGLCAGARPRALDPGSKLISSFLWSFLSFPAPRGNGRPGWGSHSQKMLPLTDVINMIEGPISSGSTHTHTHTHTLHGPGGRHFYWLLIQGKINKSADFLQPTGWLTAIGRPAVSRDMASRKLKVWDWYAFLKLKLVSSSHLVLPCVCVIFEKVKTITNSKKNLSIVQYMAEPLHALQCYML